MRSRVVSCCVCVFAILSFTSCSSSNDPEAPNGAAEQLESAKRAYEQADYANAAKQYMTLAEQGNEEAQLAIAKMMLRGEGVQKDRDKALESFKMLAARGNADAQFFLGAIYLLPQTDIPEGLKWLRLSAAQGMQDAQYLLGKAYMKGANALPQDRMQGAMWLRLAARDNLEFYQNELAAAERQMSSDEIGKARVLASQWKPVPRSEATRGE